MKIQEKKIKKRIFLTDLLFASTVKAESLEIMSPVLKGEPGR